MSYSETISYTTSASLNFSDSTLIEVASNVLRLKDLGGGTYSTASPYAYTQHANTITALSTFAESSTLPANTSITYITQLNFVDYWWNSTTTKWEASDGTVTKSNSASVINSHASTLISDLSILVNQYLSFKVFLTTTSAAARPLLTSNTIGYTWTNGSPATISQCNLYGYLSDLLGNNVIPGATTPITLYVSCDHAFFHGSRLVQPFTKTANFDSNGYVSLSVIETTTPGVKLNLGISFFDGVSRQFVKLYNAVIPNQPTIALSSLSTVIPYSFG